MLGGFEGEPDVLAAAGDAGVVEEGVLWVVGLLLLGGWFGHGCDCGGVLRGVVVQDSNGRESVREGQWL